LSIEPTGKERRSQLSRKNNINMDHYKTKGRGRQGEGVVHDEYKRLRHQIRSRRRRGLSAKQLLARKISLRPAKQTQSRSASSRIGGALERSIRSRCRVVLIVPPDQRDGALAVA